MKTIACDTPYGRGGLGQHLAQVIEEARADGLLQRYFAYSVKPGDEGTGQVVSNRNARLLQRYTPIRFSKGWRSYTDAALFDRHVARRLAAPVETYVGFVGKALQSFRRARALGARQCALHAANSHVNNVVRRHAEAIRRYGLEDSWLNETQRRKTLKEYEEADEIYVASAYTHASFLAESIPAGKLRRIHLKPDARFQPPPSRPDDGVFRIVYIGSLMVTKGIPVLLEAFSRLPVDRAELTLVGRFGSRGMRRYLARTMARDPRVRLRPGDPLRHLQRADVCVHPTYEDGFAYAPMEARACGVPVIVTEDTGMKEYVEEGVNGYIVPTGDVAALIDRLDHLHRHPMSLPSMA